MNSPHDGRRATLFGRVYVWHRQQRPAPAGRIDWRWSLRAETDVERADRIAGPVDLVGAR